MASSSFSEQPSVARLDPSREVKMSLVSRCARRFSGNKSNFTIDHILNVAGGKSDSDNVPAVAEEGRFEWLNCTRYRPPKLPRQRKKPDQARRRKLGRNPRIPFSSSQVAFLEARFLRTPYLSSSDVTQLASCLKLTETRVKIWFQNRRAREKREKERKSTRGENMSKNVSEMPPVLQQTKLLPPELPKYFFLDYGTSFGYINYADYPSYLHVATPLDLSEGQKVYNRQK